MKKGQPSNLAFVTKRASAPAPVWPVPYGAVHYAFHSRLCQHGPGVPLTPQHAAFLLCICHVPDGRCQVPCCHLSVQLHGVAGGDRPHPHFPPQAKWRTNLSPLLESMLLHPPMFLRPLPNIDHDLRANVNQ